ncbi:MAG TPA: M28 family peptidase [Jatrophihabitans sp.]|nr:M28 family peptidase [Jatrophihabitans sp.]
MVRRAVALAAAAVTAAGVATAVAVPSASAAPARLDGFTATSTAAELSAEQKFLGYPSATLARQLDQQLSRRTGLVGTANDRRRMRMIVARLRSFGLTPTVHKYYVYMSTPRRIRVTMTSPVRFTAANKERCRAVETDCKDVVVGYNALSPSGNVTAPVVYVNYGTTADYATLKRRGVSVRGKIVVARYGAVFRGVKTNLAAEHGAKAVIIYSDPKDDGNTKGTVYPKGPWRAPDGIQRGSVQQLWQYSGDPLTPGHPATKHAKRISPRKSNIAKLPTVPISYASARPILAHLGGRRAPKSWQGGLHLTYRLGSHARVHVRSQIRYHIRPVYDVTATIRGAVHPDEIVQVGAHHDAWTYGSDDNLSGAEAVLQLGRAFKQLMSTGWRPARTIRIGTWDGEEYGLFGSTEYAEQQGAKRLGHVVAYLNMDGAAGREFGASAVPSLDRVIRAVAKRVAWPGTSGTAYDNWAQNSGKKTPVPARLGSGSDYTAFLDHYGVPAADIGSSTPSGDYHCSCDNFYMEDHFIDPGWKFHVATVQVIGLAVLRLADADVVPLHYHGYATEVRGYVNALAAQQRKRFGRVPVRLATERTQATRWARAATAFDEKVSAALAGGASTATLDRYTRALERVERRLLVARGLPGRPWFKHQIYAPGVNSGYGTQVLPAINDALFLRHRPAEARRYARTLGRSLARAASALS